MYIFLHPQIRQLAVIQDGVLQITWAIITTTGVRHQSLETIIRARTHPPTIAPPHHTMLGQMPLKMIDHLLGLILVTAIFVEFKDIQPRNALLLILFQFSLPLLQSASMTTSSTPWQPQAHFAANLTFHTPQWLLDSGASHHVTTDLNILSLEVPYTGFDNIILVMEQAF